MNYDSFKRIGLFLVSQKITNSLLVIIAAANLILYFNLFGSDKIEVQFDDKLYISQNWGSLHFTQSISIKNTGAKIGHIDRIKALIRSKDSDQKKFIRQLVAEQYYDDNSKMYRPLLQFGLNPTESFYSMIDFSNPLGRFEDDSIGIYTNRIIDEVELAKKKGGVKNATVGEISKKNGRQITSFITKGFSDFRQGEYEFLIQLYKDDETTPFETKCYSFTIYEANKQSLMESIKPYTEFDFYNNVNSVLNRPSISVKLTEINGRQVIESLSKEIH